MSTDFSQDQIIILSRDGTGRTVKIKAAALLIGRNASNDIVLDDPEVSPWHARLEFDGANYRIIDLDSATGIYLAGDKLEPDALHLWEIGQNLRIGPYTLRLERATGEPVQPSPAGQTAIEPPPAAFPANDAPLKLILETPHLAVTPGGSATAIITLINKGESTEHCRLTVEGIPAAWVSLPNPVVQVDPYNPQTVQVVIRLPRSPQSRAGSYPLANHSGR